MTNKSPTMRDVAEIAGVSIQTVSAVVNNKDGISEATRLRVLEVIKQINYKRDQIARSMRTGQTGLVGLMVQDITNPVLSSLASSVEAAVSAEGFNVILYNASSNVKREQAYLELAANRLIDGLIIINAVDQAHTLRVLEETSIPAVFIDSLKKNSIPSVCTDDLRGAYLATKHLIELGHQHIAHIAGALLLEITDRRIQGYTDALVDFGLSYREVIAQERTNWDYEAGYRATKQLLESRARPTAIFAAGDELAIGAYRAIYEDGLSIPTDMSVVGFDDITAAAFAWPPLTTIRQSFDSLASNAVSLLFQLINKQDPVATQIKLEPELILRQSTAEKF